MHKAEIHLRQNVKKKIEELQEQTMEIQMQALKAIGIHGDLKTVLDVETAFIFRDLALMLRHDLFASSVASLFSPEYQGDVTADQMLQQIRAKAKSLPEMLDNINAFENNELLPSTTPDTFVYLEGEKKLRLIDFKVTRDYRRAASTTINKYLADYQHLAQELELDLKVTIVAFDLVAQNVTGTNITDAELTQLNQLFDGAITVRDDIEYLTQLTTRLDEAFMIEPLYAKLTKKDTDSPMTEPWFENKQIHDLLKNDESYKKFLDMMSYYDRKLFEELIEGHDLMSQNNETSYSERIQGMVNSYNESLVRKAKDLAKQLKEDFANDTNKEYFPHATESDIANAFESLECKVQAHYDIMADTMKAKPSVHFLWAPDSKKIKQTSFNQIPLNDTGINTDQPISEHVREETNLLKLERLIQLIKKSSYNISATKEYGGIQYKTNIPLLNMLLETADIDGKIPEYLKRKTELKEKSKNEKKKIVETIGGRLTVHPNGTFFPSSVTLNKVHSEAKIGCGYKKRENRTWQDACVETTSIDEETGAPQVQFLQKKKKSLPLNNYQTNSMVESFACETGQVLSTDTLVPRNFRDLDLLVQEISETKNKFVIDAAKAFLQTNARCMLEDIEIATRNVAAIGRLIENKGYRIFYSPNQNFFLIHVSDQNLLKKQGQSVFYTITINKAGSKKVQSGCLNLEGSVLVARDGKDTYEILISRPIRLDKTRLLHLQSSLQRGLITFSTYAYMASRNKTIFSRTSDWFQQACLISVFQSLSISKAVTTVVEPAKYIIPCSIADYSNISQYITDKFEPSAKTWFSLYLYNKLKTASLNVSKHIAQIQYERIYISEDVVYEKGIKKANLPGIYNTGIQHVEISDYLNEIALLFYNTSKNLHGGYQSLLKLYKVPIEYQQLYEKKIERDSKFSLWDNSGSFSIGLPNFISTVATFYNKMQPVLSTVRTRAELSEHFLDPINSIKTMTSSKTCVEETSATKCINESLANLIELTNKSEVSRHAEVAIAVKTHNKEKRDNLKLRIWGSKLCLLRKGQIITEELRKQIPDYINIQKTKVSNAVYKIIKSRLNENANDPCLLKTIAEKSILTKQVYNFTLFPKGQRTPVDREIYEGEIEYKLAAYMIEHFFKYFCKAHPSEMISEPGDSKVIEMESCRRRLYQRLQERLTASPGSMTVMQEINADQTKWSAQDLSYKFFWLIALNPYLHPIEKKYFILFLSRYTTKRLIISEPTFSELKNTSILGYEQQDDKFKYATNNFLRNYINLEQNWLQGNFNYLSSLVHAISMMQFNDILPLVFKSLLNLNAAKIYTHTESMVHSDDNSTGVIISIEKKAKSFGHAEMEKSPLSQKNLGCLLMTIFTNCQQEFSIFLNTKKTYLSANVKEFISQYNINGEQSSIWVRDLLPVVGATPYSSPLEDLFAMVSHLQTSVIKGAPTSVVAIALACCQDLNYRIYGMHKNGINDPGSIFNLQSKAYLPSQFGGLITCPDYLLALYGPGANDAFKLIQILDKLTLPMVPKTDAKDVMQFTHLTNKFTIDRLSHDETVFIKLLFLLYNVKDIENSAASDDSTWLDPDSIKPKILFKPRRFVTSRIIKTFDFYQDYCNAIADEELREDFLQKVLLDPTITFSKPHDPKTFLTYLQAKCMSLNFLESLSVNSESQLLLDKITYSAAPIIRKDYFTEFKRKRNYEILTDDNAHIGTLSEYITLRDAMKTVAGGLDHFDLTVPHIQDILENILYSNKKLCYYINAYLNLEVTMDSYPSKTSLAKFLEPPKSRELNNPPAQIIKRALYPHTVTSFDKILYTGNLANEIKYLTNFLERIPLYAMFAQRFTLQLEVHLNLVSTINMLAFSFLTMYSTRSQVYFLKNRPRDYAQFFCTLVGSRFHDTTYTHCVLRALPMFETGTSLMVETLINNDINYIVKIIYALCHFVERTFSSNIRQSVLNHYLNGCKYRKLTLQQHLYALKGKVNPVTQGRLEQVKFISGLPYDREYLKQSYDNMLINSAQWIVKSIDRSSLTGPFLVIYRTPGSTVTVTGKDSSINRLDYEIPENTEFGAVQQRIQELEKKIYKDFHKNKLRDTDLKQVNKSDLQIGDIIWIDPQGKKRWQIKICTAQYLNKVKTLGKVILRHNTAQASIHSGLINKEMPESLEDYIDYHKNSDKCLSITEVQLNEDTVSHLPAAELTNLMKIDYSDDITYKGLLLSTIIKSQKLLRYLDGRISDLQLQDMASWFRFVNFKTNSIVPDSINLDSLQDLFDLAPIDTVSETLMQIGGKFSVSTKPKKAPLDFGTLQTMLQEQLQPAVENVKFHTLDLKDSSSVFKYILYATHLILYTTDLTKAESYILQQFYNLILFCLPDDTITAANEIIQKVDETVTNNAFVEGSLRHENKDGYFKPSLMNIIKIVLNKVKLLLYNMRQTNEASFYFYHHVEKIFVSSFEAFVQTNNINRTNFEEATLQTNLIELIGFGEVDWTQEICET
uniref:RNA-directed RNA polymerase L n=1 Tax=Tonghua tick virus 1 TaxID=2972292 RepID=A0A9E7V266_9VIRU|nr:MAG: RNA-dependent RNA polymerase [Tonghua tick virus 1]